MKKFLALASCLSLFGCTTTASQIESMKQGCFYKYKEIVGQMTINATPWVASWMLPQEETMVLLDGTLISAEDGIITHTKKITRDDNELLYTWFSVEVIGKNKEGVVVVSGELTRYIIISKETEKEYNERSTSKKYTTILGSCLDHRQQYNIYIDNLLKIGDSEEYIPEEMYEQFINSRTPRFK